MAVLPESQWRSQYPYANIPYQEYVRLQTAAEGGVTSTISQPVTQQATTQNQQQSGDQPLTVQLYDGSRAQDVQYYPDSTLTLNPAGYYKLQSPSHPGWQFTVPTQWGGLLQSKTGIKAANQAASTTTQQATSGTKNAQGQTFTMFYNQLKASNPNITLDQAHAQFNGPQSSTQNPTGNGSSGGSSGGSSTPTAQQNFNTFLVNNPQLNETQKASAATSFGATYTPVNDGSSTSTYVPTLNGQPVAGSSGGTVLPPQSQTSPAAGTASNDKALQTLLNSPAYQGLPEDQKAMLRMVVQNWDVGTELNMENVLKEFDNIKNSTIDPYFSEQVSTFTKNIQNQYNELQASRGLELQAENQTKTDNIRNTQRNLEASGLTFSGEANRQLGNQSAYVPFANQPEGLVNTSNRMMASSSLANYNKNMMSLGLAAEQGLGNQMGSGLIPGYSPLGISTGSIQENKTKQLGSTLSSLAGQQQNLNQYKTPVNFSSFNNIFS